MTVSPTGGHVPITAPWDNCLDNLCDVNPMVLEQSRSFKGDNSTEVKAVGTPAPRDLSSADLMFLSSKPQDSSPDDAKAGITRLDKNDNLLNSGSTIDFRRLPDIYGRDNQAGNGLLDLKTGLWGEPRLELASALRSEARTGRRGDSRVKETTPPVAPESTDPKEIMLRSAERNIKDPGKLTLFKNDAKTFAQRATKDGIDASDVSKTFENINRLLVGKTGSPIPKSRQVQLARDVMRQVADPAKICQGANNTCTVTSMENILYSKQPAEASKLVADVGTTGSFTAQDGTKVTLDQKSMTPDGEGERATPMDGGRSFATQLFNVTSVNLHYQKNAPHLRYENHPPTKTSEGGERVMDYSKTPPVPAQNKCGDIKEPNLWDDELVGIYTSITGKDGTDLMLKHTDNSDGVNDIRSTRFSTQQEFTDKLLELKRDGKLPTILSMNTAVQPFFSDAGGGKPQQYEGDHVLVIRDINPGPPVTVAVDNQYNTSADHLGKKALGVREVYLSTLPTPKVIEHLEKEIREEKARGKVDQQKVAELRRLRLHTPPKQCD